MELEAENKLREFCSSKKYQVEIELLGKRTFAYLDDLSLLDIMIKAAKGRIIEVTNLNNNKT